MSTVGDNVVAENASWSFSDGVVEKFGEHVSKSVPFYNEGHQLICNMSDFFIKHDSVCYDLGTSTGEIPIKLSEHNVNKSSAKYIGLDIEESMVARANKKKNNKNINNVSFITDSILEYEYEPSDFITSYYCLQFVRPSERQLLIDKIYKSLKWGGGFVLFEKVRANDARFQDMMTSLYYEYKLERGYVPEEIFSKTRSLKGVLEPFSTEGNLGLLKRAGFEDVTTVSKYICFEGFLAIK